MSTDSTARATPVSEYTEPRKSQPAMYCSECKAIMRMMYYSLDERPLCQKCGAMYRERIEQGTGPGAMGRAVLYGTGAATAGMIGVAIVLSVFNGFRIITAIGVAYLIAKAINSATGNYGGRRYQLLATGLTYVALGLAMLVPVFRAMHALEKVQAPPKLEARSGPAGERASSTTRSARSTPPLARTRTPPRLPHAPIPSPPRTACTAWSRRAPS